VSLQLQFQRNGHVTTPYHGKFSHQHPLLIPKLNSLPLEIRLIIWSYALPPPRIICLEYHFKLPYLCNRTRSDIAIDALDSNGVPAFFTTSSLITPSQGQMAIKNDKFTPKVPPPVHLYICRESLNVASKHYSRVFGASHSFRKYILILREIRCI
jgi:hypothetical protein